MERFTEYRLLVSQKSFRLQANCPGQAIQLWPPFSTQSKISSSNQCQLPMIRRFDNDFISILTDLPRARKYFFITGNDLKARKTFSFQLAANYLAACRRRNWRRWIILQSDACYEKWVRKLAGDRTRSALYRYLHDIFVWAWGGSLTVWFYPSVQFATQVINLKAAWQLDRFRRLRPGQSGQSHEDQDAKHANGFFAFTALLTFRMRRLVPYFALSHVMMSLSVRPDPPMIWSRSPSILNERI